MTKHTKPWQKAKGQNPATSSGSKGRTLSQFKIPDRYQSSVAFSEPEDDDESFGVEVEGQPSSGSISNEEELGEAEGAYEQIEEVEDDDGDDAYEDIEDSEEEEGEGMEDVVDDDDDDDFETEDEDREDNNGPTGAGEHGFVTEDEETERQTTKQAVLSVARLSSKKQHKHTSKKSAPLQRRHSRKQEHTSTDSDEDFEEDVRHDPAIYKLIEGDDSSGEWSTDEDEDEDEDYVDTRPSRAPFEDQVSVRLSDEQEEAIRICQAKVKKIVKACRAGNRKFRDIEFDLLNDKHRTYYGLLPMDSDSDSDDEEPDDEDDDSKDSTSDVSDTSASSEEDEDEDSSNGEEDDLTSDAESDGLPDVRRVTEIFDKPKFFTDVPGSNDVMQGTLGDCWFLSALAATSTVPGLIEKCCVARDEEVGVYGFIFQRDGRWVSVVVDDQLFWGLPKFEELSRAEQELYHDDKDLYNTLNRKTGKGLHMSQSGQTGETWVPLIEKAFAKLHGDYKSLEGGWTGEAIEDLTGGVTTTINTADILDIDRFWKEDLCLVNTRQRLFAVGYFLAPNEPGTTASGLVPGHAYSVLRVQECRGKRFLVLRNPWGKFEWTGPWSDGSKEWTGEWIGVLKELGHSLGDDGAFVMEYKDFLSHWETIQSTTLFDSSWILSSHWVHVPSRPPIHQWTFGDVIFNFILPKACKTYIVLSQLDARYFRLVEGNATWNLEFAVYKRGDSEPMGTSYSGQFFDRSGTCSLDLDEGEYLVFPRVDRFDNKPSGFMKDCIEYFDKRKLSRAFSERTIARAMASNYDLGSKLHHLPQTLYEAIDDDLSGSEDSECDEEDANAGSEDDDDRLLEEDVLEVRTTTTTTTTQVVEETVATNPSTSAFVPSTRMGTQPTSIPLPETVTAALDVEDAPSKGYIIVLDSEKDLIGQPIRFGPWTEREIEDEENADTTSDAGDGTTEDNTTVDGEIEGQCKGDRSEGLLLEDITGDDEDTKPLWLGLKVYMQFEDTLDTTTDVQL
ncbi:hypothetical protein CPB83DRAFT_260499 [Crepidotus variabilis]|uniref:Calpain catalytic domain-containing protein n=1 Tax=Crepidotus variabilis TaxID=179855 RepID=A0A9P6JRD5_9AGAR|nr:hypothetical protein CPB83DRAFT_260499 [Crepidotus variabilis]